MIVALDFNGTTQDVDPGNETALEGQFPMTVGAWLSWDTAADGAIVSRGRLGVSGWSFYADFISPNNELTLLKHGVRQDSSSGLAIPTGSWVYVACVMSASNSMRFVKITPAGVVSTSSNTNNANFTGTPTESGIAVNRNSGGTKISFLNGKLAHVVKLDAALSDNELVTLAFTMRSPAKAFWMPLGVSSPEVDWSGGGASGTRTNSPTVYANPPHGPLFGYDVMEAYAVAAAVQTLDMWEMRGQREPMRRRYEVVGY